jgi:hypothetical protein
MFMTSHMFSSSPFLSYQAGFKSEFSSSDHNYMVLILYINTYFELFFGFWTYFHDFYVKSYFCGYIFDVKLILHFYRLQILKLSSF